MRKPRDFDAELLALNEKAKALKAAKFSQLGELVISCGADALSLDELAGALLAAAQTKDPKTKEAWAMKGASFFQAKRARTRPPATTKQARLSPDAPGQASLPIGDGAS